MRLLLDSHVVLWWLDDPQRLAAPVRVAISDPTNDVFFSPASIWELGLKVTRGKLKLPPNLTNALEKDSIVELPITSQHAARSSMLPMIHLDPFDRLLIAQALCEGLVLATRDDMIMRYDVPTIDA